MLSPFVVRFVAGIPNLLNPDQHTRTTKDSQREEKPATRKSALHGILTALHVPHKRARFITPRHIAKDETVTAKTIQVNGEGFLLR